MPQRRAAAAEARARAAAASAARVQALLELEDATSEKRKTLLRDRKGWTEQHEAEFSRTSAELSARAEALEAVRDYDPCAYVHLALERSVLCCVASTLAFILRPGPAAELSAQRRVQRFPPQECREALEAVQRDAELLAAYPELGIPLD